jgi:hypothetical protein
MLLLWMVLLYFGVAIHLFVKSMTTLAGQHMSLWGKIRLSFGWALMWYWLRKTNND